MKSVEEKGKLETLKKGIKINSFTKKFGLDLSQKLFKDILAVFGGNMRMLITGGAAINPAVLDGFNNFGLIALQGFGLTECSPLAALNSTPGRRSASAGVVIPGMEIVAHDPDDNGIGELWIKSPSVMLGYYNMPEETAEILADGWFHTGDLGYVDKDSYVYITGRKKNVIIAKNGKNIFPEELEYHLSNIPYVSESMVYGTETESGEDIMLAAAVLPDADAMESACGKDWTTEQAEELLWKEIDKINAELPAWKMIKKLVVRTEEFEKSTTNKIKRHVESNKGATR
jgi:long-subunit acyl-CoA synthetase (AMP-forming)